MLLESLKRENAFHAANFLLTSKASHIGKLALDFSCKIQIVYKQKIIIFTFRRPQQQLLLLLIKMIKQIQVSMSESEGERYNIQIFSTTISTQFYYHNKIHANIYTCMQGLSGFPQMRLAVIACVLMNRP